MKASEKFGYACICGSVIFLCLNLICSPYWNAERPEGFWKIICSICYGTQNLGVTVVMAGLLRLGQWLIKRSHESTE